MKTIPAVLAAAVFCAGLSAQERRPPSSEELTLGLQTPQPVHVLDGGQVADRFAVSADGRWVVYAYYDEDIKSNNIRLVSSEDRTRREVAVPRGFKHTPLIWDNRLLFFTLDSPPGSTYPDGIYSGPWEGPPDRWKLFEAGSYLDLAVSDDGRYLAASAETDHRAGALSVIKVWAVGAGGAKAGPGYSVGTGVAGQVRQIAWGPRARGLVIEINIKKTGWEWGQSNLYTTENRSGSPARLLRVNGRNPVFGLKNGFPLLFFNEGDWQRSRIFAVRPGNPVETLVATLDNLEGLGLTANGMAWDPAGRRLLLGVQASATTAGIVGFSPP